MGKPENALDQLIKALAEPIAAAVLEIIKPQLVVQPQSKPADRLIRVHEVLELVHVSRSTWHQGVKDGRFPKPVKSGRITAWRMSDIECLINEKPAG